MKGTPKLTTLSIRFYNKIKNQEKKEKQKRERARERERGMEEHRKEIKIMQYKMYFYCTHKLSRFVILRLSISRDIPRQLS